MDNDFRTFQGFLDLFSQVRLMDKMDLRVSQLLIYLLPNELKWSSVSRIDFCGDWFYSNSIGGVQSTMNSSIILAKLLDLD